MFFKFNTLKFKKKTLFKNDSQFSNPKPKSIKPKQYN